MDLGEDKVVGPQRLPDLQAAAAALLDERLLRRDAVVVGVERLFSFLLFLLSDGVQLVRLPLELALSPLQRDQLVPEEGSCASIEQTYIG